MWTKKYEDYPADKPLKKERVRPGKGIVGCEMHDLNGWGNRHHYSKAERKRGWLRSFLHKMWGK